MRNTVIATTLASGSLAVTAQAALVVTNGDFEADDFTVVEASTQDITGWFESAPTTAYREWLRDSPGNHGSPTGGAAVGTANNWAAFSGNATSGGTAPLYLHQSLGTLSAGTSTINVSGVSSDRSGRDGAGRHSAIVQVSLWYDDGTAVLADGTELANTTGLTLIQAFSVGAAVGGAFSAEGGGAPDIDLTTLNPTGQARSEAWQRSISLSGSAVAEGDTVYLQIRYFDSDTVNSRSEAYFDNIQVSEVPEPSVALLGGLGLLGMMRRRRA